MLREGAVFAREIIEFFSDRGVECSVVDEHSSLLVLLYGEGGTHEFRCGGRMFGRGGGKRFYQGMQRELSLLKEAGRRGAGYEEGI